jgi:hypothetical protein
MIISVIALSRDWMDVGVLDVARGQGRENKRPQVGPGKVLKVSISLKTMSRKR